ncbi:unnamed protein product [Gongylonema pulchrum]|uniref:Glyco_hydro_18 domain-containing protein n=1 Tax=Gongylonema pulchrum TaxID=637853 RepID=A0A183DL45_9BILA|nr:unnamed protein product [Gongylonema pulchrum]
MKKLVSDVTQYLTENDADGFDIDWEFPVWSRDAQPTDKKAFALLIKLFFYTSDICVKSFQEMREAFDKAKAGLLLTAAVAAPFTVVDKAYDIDAFNKLSFAFAVQKTLFRILTVV